MDIKWDDTPHEDNQILQTSLLSSNNWAENFLTKVLHTNKKCAPFPTCTFLSQITSNCPSISFPPHKTPYHYSTKSAVLTRKGQSTKITGNTRVHAQMMAP